jgi:hypothetical protein
MPADTEDYPTTMGRAVRSLACVRFAQCSLKTT